MKAGVSAAAVVAMASTASVVWAQSEATQRCISAMTLAQDLVDQRKLRAAREQFGVCAQSTCPAEIQTECARQLAVVRKRLPSVVVEVRSASGARVTDALIFIDGGLVSNVADDVARDVDPGRHKITVKHGARVVDKDFVAQDGTQRQRVVMRFPTASTPNDSDPVPAPEPGAGGDSDGRCRFRLGPRLGVLGPNSYVNASLAMQFRGACGLELSLGVGYQFHPQTDSRSNALASHAIPILVRLTTWTGQNHAFLFDAGVGLTAYAIRSIDLEPQPGLTDPGYSRSGAVFASSVGAGYGYRMDAGWRFTLLGGVVMQVGTLPRGSICDTAPGRHGCVNEFLSLDLFALDAATNTQLMGDPAVRVSVVEFAPYWQAAVAYLF
jgi:hypothetical protein